jgi:hypothetical protein
VSVQNVGKCFGGATGAFLGGIFSDSHGFADFAQRATFEISEEQHPPVLLWKFEESLIQGVER